MDAVGGIAQLIAMIVDVAADGPGKRAKAANATKAAAQAELEAAKIQYQTAMIEQTQPKAQAGGLFAGLPSWAPLVAGGVLVYLLVRR